MKVKTVALASGVKLPYVEQGDDSGTPLLLLHGFAGSWWSFKLMLPHLPASMHAFALTQRGHGDATKPARGYRLPDFAADVAAFMDALEITSAVIVGHSMGSGVAQRFAIDYPERVLGLVLVGACVIEPGGPKAQAFWDTTVSQLSDPIDPSLVHEFGEGLFVQPVPQEWFKRWVEDSLKVPVRVWKAAWKGRLEASNAVNELDQIEAPTLVIWGDGDTRCPRRHQETLIEEIPDARLVVYPGAGHGLHAEEPERFATDVAAFVRDRVL